MPKPANLHDLVHLIRRSRVVDSGRLEGYLHEIRADEPGGPTPEGLLARLTTDGVLTRFQADLLAAGRWKGFTVGGYRLLDKLGAGGMGTVYLAEPDGPVGGPRVAVKVLDARLADDRLARERFAREAWAAAALAHRNIVHVLSVHPAAHPPYLVMEYVDGLTLQAAVARGGTFSAGTAAHCGREVALGLQRAADIGLVHRDIKPANLVVDRDGTVKILDLGIVSVPGGDLTQKFDARTILGTADYLAPEQAVDSSNVDTRADIYALGGTLYFLLAGHPPFPAGRPDEKLARKQAADPVRIDHLRPDVPAGLAAVVHKMLARRPDDRYSMPAEAAAALAPWADPDPGFPAALMAVHAPAADASDCATCADGRPPDAEPAPTGVQTAVIAIAAATDQMQAAATPADASSVRPLATLARSRAIRWASMAAAAIGLVVGILAAVGH